MAIPYNKARGKEFSKNPKPARGCHVGIVIQAEAYDSENNDNIMGRLFIQKLLDADNAESRKGPKVPLYLTLPLDNPDVEGHEAPQFSGRMWAQTAQVFNEEIPKLPTFDRDTRQWSLNGEPLEDRAEVDAATLAAVNAAGEWASELYGEAGEGLTELEGFVVYYKVDYDKGSDFPQIKALHSECPPDWELTDDVIDTADEPEEAAEPAKPARSRKKAASKKKSRRRK